MDMFCNQVMEKVSFLMCGKDICRFDMYEENERKVVAVDLHGLHRREAKRMINNVIVMCRFEFELILIHGYNSGTVLKEMIWNEDISGRIKNMYCACNNPGRTYIEITNP